MILSRWLRILVYTISVLCSVMQNDFNFKKRDWMTVRSSELPPGKELVKET